MARMKDSRARRQWLAVGMIIGMFIGSLVPVFAPSRADITTRNPPTVLTITKPTACIVQQASPTLSQCNSDSPALSVQRAATAAIRLLVQFSLSSLPMNAQVIQATLDVDVNQPTIGQASGQETGFILRLTGGTWGTTVTWNNCPTVAGCSFDTTGIGLFEYSYTNSFGGSPPIRFPITKYVQGVQNGTFPNFGIALLAAGTGADGVAPTSSYVVGWSNLVVTISYALPSSIVNPYYYCTGGPCASDVFQGEGLNPWLFNVSWREGGLGRGYISGDSVKAANAASLQATTALSQSMWVKLKTTGSQFNIFDKSSSYGFRILGSNVFSPYRLSATVLGTCDGTTVLKAGVWYLLSDTYDSAAGFKTYINGTAEATCSGVTGSIDTNTNSLCIGSSSSGTICVAQGFDGSLDDPHIYTRVLSTSEVGQLWNALGDPSSTNLVLWYDMVTLDTAGTMHDFSAGGNAGTISGTSLSEGSIHCDGTLNALCAATPFKTVNQVIIPANTSKQGQLRVQDFFGNIFTNKTFSITSNPFPIQIPVTYRALKFYNERDNITSVSITVSGAPTPMAFDLVPKEWWNKGIRQGTAMTITFTLKDRNQNAVGTATISRTISGITDYIVNGTSITQVISNLNGVTTTVNNILVQTSPGIIGTLGNTPFIPPPGSWFAPASVVLNQTDPFYTLNYGARKNSTVCGTSAAPVTYFKPYDKTLQFQVLTDQLWLATTGVTRWWINDTKDGGTPVVLYDSNSRGLNFNPVSLNGQNITIAAQGCGTMYSERIVSIKVSAAYNWAQNQATKQYTTTVSISNPTNWNWYSVYTFISLVPNVVADLSTITVRDATSNTLLLNGLHYTVTAGGIWTALQFLNSSKTQSWQITFYRLNQTSTILRPSCVDQSVPTTVVRGTTTYQLVKVLCQNTNPTDYVGEITVPFPVTPTTQLAYGSIIVDDCSTGPCIQVYPGGRYQGTFVPSAQALYLEGVRVPAQGSITLNLWYFESPPPLTPNWVKLYWPVIDLFLLAGAFIMIMIIALDRWSFRGPAHVHRWESRSIVVAWMLFFIFIVLAAALPVIFASRLGTV